MFSCGETDCNTSICVQYRANNHNSWSDKPNILVEQSQLASDKPNWKSDNTNPQSKKPNSVG